MRYAAPLAIVATALAAGLTVVAVRALGPGVEAHPITRVAAVNLGWTWYLSLSIVALGVGLRLLAAFPFAEWGVRAVALAKSVDAIRDAWIVTTHPAIRVGSIETLLPSVLALAGAAAVALLIVRGWPATRPRVDPEVAV